jgi:hypothetical protein
MAFIELKLLIFVQLAIDVVVIVIFILFIRRFKSLQYHPLLNDGVKIFESLLKDADHLSDQFKKQLEEKKCLLKRLDDQLGKKITSLNVFLNRSEALLSGHQRKKENHDTPLTHSRPERKILKLSKEGCDIENIAGTLLMPKEEVKLVLDLNKKISRLSHKEGVS